jgi:hypothetical protein
MLSVLTKTGTVDYQNKRKYYHLSQLSLSKTVMVRFRTQLYGHRRRGNVWKVTPEEHIAVVRIGGCGVVVLFENICCKSRCEKAVVTRYC